MKVKCATCKTEFERGFLPQTLEAYSSAHYTLCIPCEVEITVSGIQSRYYNQFKAGLPTGHLSAQVKHRLSAVTHEQYEQVIAELFHIIDVFLARYRSDIFWEQSQKKT